MEVVLGNNNNRNPPLNFATAMSTLAILVNVSFLEQDWTG